MAKPSKTPVIEQFVNSNIGLTLSTKEMCERIGVSLPTLLNYIKANTERFELVSYGTYRIVTATNSATA